MKKLIELLALVSLIICSIFPFMAKIGDPNAVDAGVMTLGYIIFNAPFFLTALILFGIGAVSLKRGEKRKAIKLYSISFVISLAGILFILSYSHHV